MKETNTQPITAPAVASSELLAAALRYIHANINETATSDDTPAGLALDSLDLVEITIDVEEQCNCLIEDAWTDMFNDDWTLQECADFIARQLAENERLEEIWHFLKLTPSTE